MAAKKWHCKCGASFTYHSSTPPHVLAILKADHVGPGHGECDAKTAARVRRKQESAIMIARWQAGMKRL